MIDVYSRYQRQLCLEHLYPSLYPLCSCGCGQVLTGRKKRWYEPAHVQEPLHNFRIIQGDSQYIRKCLFERDKGVCVSCGLDCIFGYWEADHIIPVHKGGGACGLENYQTLCKDCHKEKSINERKK